MMLDLAVTHRQGDFTLDINLSLKGPVSALFGPSGAGKTTLLRMIAGLVKPDTGRISFRDEVWFDSAAGINVPAHRRRIGYVFQDGRLFPHFKVRTNLAYGRWFRPARKGQNGKRIDMAEVIALLGIDHLLDRRPSNLSGGEVQRVAIARALASNPGLLLMDEPLASLDTARREEILPYIECLRDRFGLPTLYVSHARAEIERLASEIIVMEAGRVVSVQHV